MIPGVAWLETAFGVVFDWLAGLIYFAALLMATLLLFPAVVTVVVGLFLDRVVEAVEARHYPGQPPARPQPVAEVVWSTVRFRSEEHTSELQSLMRISYAVFCL